MRKDVRMGFAVGGILLAVVIVAVLVIHRNHNDKQVAFDPGKGSAASTDATPADAPEKPLDVTPTPAPAPATPDQPANVRSTAPQTELGHTDAPKEAGNQWDALFASTEDPIKANLTSPPAKPRNKPTEAKSAPKPDTAQAGGANRSTDISSLPAAPTRDSLPNTVAVTTAGPDKAQTYTVKQGETFTSIAKRVYGQSKYYMAIERANPLINADKLKPGTVIQLPSADEAKQSGKTGAASASHHAESAPAADAPTGPALASDGKTYTVQKDDNLYRIARKLYGKGNREDEIYELNKDLIGPDRARLKLGMVLKLPEAPVAQASR